MKSKMNIISFLLENVRQLRLKFFELRAMMMIDDECDNYDGGDDD